LLLIAASQTKLPNEATHHHKEEFEKVYNPSANYDTVPFPQCMADRDKVKEDDNLVLPVKVPLIHVQITGNKAEMKWKWSVPKKKKSWRIRI
jgi:hypothetical protein